MEEGWGAFPSEAKITIPVLRIAHLQCVFASSFSFYASIGIGMTWNRTIAIGVAAALVLALLIYGFWPTATPVTIQEVTRDSMKVTVDAEGQTRLVESYVVHAPAAGYLQRVPWSVGDTVSAGAVLTQLTTQPAPVLDARHLAAAQAQVGAAQAAVAQSQAEAERATAAAKYAQAEHDRIARLHRDGTASEQQLDAARSEARQATAREAAAQQGVRRARQELRAAEAQAASHEAFAGRTEAAPVPVRAPVEGQVLRVLRESAGPVAAGTPLLEIGRPDSVEVVVDVLSSDAVRIQPGGTVELTQWGGGESLPGRVHRVEPIGRTEVSALGVEEQRVDVVVRIAGSAPAHAGLGTGYRVVARFVLWEGADVLQVPQSALFRHEGGWAVFVVRGGRAERRLVTVGHRSGLQAQITSGLSAGDRVVTHPGNALADGARVEAR